MKLLLDTHLLLWAGVADTAESSRALPAKARALIADPANELCFSPASVWEVAIKNALGKPDFSVDPRIFRRALLDNGYIELPISSEHTAGVANLPNHHKDPFDRILISQATVEGITLLTDDQTIAVYTTSPIWLASE